MTEERSNQEWLDALRSPEPDEALAKLRTLLVRGLRYALADRFNVTEDDLEDFAQNALLRILDNLHTFRGEGRFTTWAHKIAVRVAFTELRRRRWQEVSLQDLIARYDAGDFTPAALTNHTAGPERRTTQRLMLETIQRIIAEELTERQRQAMTAVMMGGMPLEEVARRMGTNRNALYKLLHDARQHLKKRLLAEGLTPQEVLAAFEE